ncbi:MAG TPA: type 4a pilus biogenesis protein PilO [Trueperaceae bacterium]
MKIGSFDLRNLRQRDIAIVCIALTVLAAVLWYFYMYRPTLLEAQDLETEITTLTAQVARGEAARRNLPTLRLEVARLEREREIFLSQLPLESEVASLLDQLRVSATDADVEVLSIAQGNASEPIQDVRPLGFQLNTNGTFSETMAFLMELEELQRFTKIRQVGLNVTDGGGVDPELSANYAFTVYVFTGNDPGDPVQ